jgi:predicted glutamine amidotransferase
VCRLYGFRATEPTKVECTLVHSQNALIVQSREDMAGLEHGHGWGIATYADHVPQLDRMAWAAHHGEHFHRAAARVYSRTVIAHVRRATTGGISLANTHPFTDGRWTFAHNGTLPGFGDGVRTRLLDAMSPGHRAAIGGQTDSEHVFRLLLSAIDRRPRSDLCDVVATSLADIVRWCGETAPGQPIGLNVLLTDGEQLVGSRWGRSLSWVHRDRVLDCEICGFPHVHHDPHTDYRAVVVASEPLTHERWCDVPERSVFVASPSSGLSVAALLVHGAVEH